MTDEGTFGVALKVTRCAVAGRYEYRLTLGGETVGKSVFLQGNPTAGQKRHALFILLGLHRGPDG